MTIKLQHRQHIDLDFDFMWVKWGVFFCTTVSSAPTIFLWVVAIVSILMVKFWSYNLDKRCIAATTMQMQFQCNPSVAVPQAKNSIKPDRFESMEIVSCIISTICVWGIIWTTPEITSLLGKQTTFFVRTDFFLSVVWSHVFVLPSWQIVPQFP